MYAGEPPATENYERVEANGLKIYLPREAVITPEGISISLTGVGIWQHLKVEGLLY